jgi:hypothetical protein
MRVRRAMIHVAVAEAAVLLTASLGYANISNTSATVRPNNSLLQLPCIFGGTQSFFR